MAESHPKNFAILRLLEDVPNVHEGRYSELSKVGVIDADQSHFLDAMDALGKL